MMRPLRIAIAFAGLLLLNLSATLAKIGIGSVEARQVLGLYRSLGQSDRIAYRTNLRSALRQIRLARRSVKNSAVVPVQTNLTRTSDRVFILGSGPSINDLSQKEFDHIAAHDSWGFNIWFVHSFVPTTLFMQAGTARNRNVELMEAMDTSFEKVADKYRNTKIVFKGGDLFHGFDITASRAYQILLNAKVSEISVLPTLLVPKDVHQTAKDVFDELRHAGLFFAATGVCPPVPQIRSTVGLLIVLAVQMGYKEIVLCGVDGKDRVHFYDLESYQMRFPELKRVPESYKIVERHPHTIVEQTGLSPLDYLVVLAEYCKENFDVDIKIASTQSYLTGKLPLYSFDVGELEAL